MSKHTKTSQIKLGIIAEDKSDVKTLEKIIPKIKPSRSFSFKDMVTKGCAKIKIKGQAYSKTLKDRGCTHLIVVQDSDGKNADHLKRDLEKSIDTTHIKDRLILVTVQELEAWLLADTEAIHKCFSKAKGVSLKQFHSPETINNPKEKIEEYVYAKYKTRYLNTVHNAKIAENINIKNLASRCPAFLNLQSFINKA
jgi:hypothetical protein